MTRLVCEQGVEAATVTGVICMAKVSRSTFYELFEGREHCLREVIEEAVALAAARASAAYANEKRWADRVRAALLALLEFFDEEPALARLCVVQALAAGPETLVYRVRELDRLARVIHRGRDASQSVAEPPPLTAEAIVGGTLGIVYARLLRADPRPLVDLLNPLMSIVVLPYLGTAAARQEASRPDRARAAEVRRAREIVRDPLEGLNIRLTYRTLRAIAAVAAQPGLRNGEVGERAGITDAGQVSKLLARLARLGLLENTGPGQARGGANAWYLTQRGAELARAIKRDSPF